jgi:hypothetical protein
MRFSQYGRAYYNLVLVFSAPTYTLPKKKGLLPILNFKMLREKDPVKMLLGGPNHFQLQRVAQLTKSSVVTRYPDTDGLNPSIP